ncbi:unnamed protein product [Oppiella nova]|uniref:C3H1-type domain-containing protein n=1 Tax=Oppiella nova TaxID=334625 RepID=A0A7R9LDR3_9ACAR|nr:unnamed protein product [Oppiella nova]CAG2162619.1 unnamed protein product [Oppiella nova]
MSHQTEVEVLSAHTSSLTTVPCVQLSVNNVTHWWPHVLQSINASHFVAIDLELSGLGARDRLNAKKIDERYEGVMSAAKSRSIVSVGLAFFSFCANDCNQTIVNNVCDTKYGTSCETNVNSKPLLSNCISDCVEDMNRFERLLDTQLMDKLDDHTNGCNGKTLLLIHTLGLWYAKERPVPKLKLPVTDVPNRYHRGNDTEYEDLTAPSLRNLISEIIRQKLPIVLHNGFIDLIFLYQNLYSDLPQDLQTFIADLVELFPAGILDTKYIADFHERLNRSYLEYLFYDRQRFNIERSLQGKTCIDITFPLLSNNSLDIEYKDLSTKISSESDLLVDVCDDYANHGWCRLKNSCYRSHNIDHILNKKNRSKRMKKLIKKLKKKSEEHTIESTSGGDNSSVESINTKQSKQGAHRAGYDAFMTGYYFASYLAVNAKSRPLPSKPLNCKSLGISAIVNNIYLTGKDQPLRVTASSFAKTSTNHKNKTEYEDLTAPSLRNLISEIIRQKLPIVLHNGFIDLIFLYQNLYSDLPQDLQTFIADLVELFPAGILDTKYIADFHERLNRSYLEYLFYDRQRFNIERSLQGKTCIDITFPLLSNNSLDIEYKDLSTKISSESDLLVDVCDDYANHGWCRLKNSCYRSHNIDHILNKKNRSKRMKKLIKKLKKKSEEHTIESTSGGDNSSVESINTKQSKQGAHRAGYDAFMTGYYFASYLAVNAKSRPLPSKPLNWFSNP